VKLKEFFVANLDVSAGVPMTSEKPLPRHQARWRKNLTTYIFVLPYVVTMLLFGLGPGLYALLISFANFGGGVPRYFAAGFRNYMAVFKDFRFGFTLSNIAAFLAISIPLGISLVVILALLLHMRPGKLSSALRTIYFMGGAVTGPVLMLVFIIMLNPFISPFGPFLRAFGLNTFDDVVTPRSLALLFTIIGFFSGAGMWISIQYGALEGIPMELLEAAKIDGCDAWKQVLYIKLPLIRPYIIYQFILIFAGNVQLFVEPQLLGNQTYIQGNVPHIWSPNQLAYSFAFEMGNFGAAAALSLLMLIIGLGASYLVIRWTGFFNIEAR
jgi:multiple sugar transport system permease protein